jgi:lactate permease
MSAMQFIVITLNLLSLVGLMSSLSGLLTMYILYSVREKPGIPKKLYKSSLTLSKALLPYMMIIAFSLLFQIIDLEQYNFSFKYPAFSTKLGYAVEMEKAYSKIKIFGHPAPIIIMSSIVCIIVYMKAGIWENKKFINVLYKTVNKCVSTTISLVFLITMALLMMDSGMTNTLSLKVAEITGKLYPLFAPLFGIVGSFITGSNTNSNVIFGKFQVSVANTLGINQFIMAGVQSIAGSIGVSLGPTTILMASSASGLAGQESKIYNNVIKPVILTSILMGILNYFFLVVFEINIGVLQ